MVTIVLAQILGITFVVFGLAMIFQRKYVVQASAELLQSKGLLFVGGIITLFLGAVLVTLNNIWTSGIPLLVTIIGWLALIKGIFILLFPNSAHLLYRKVNKNSTFIIAGLVMIILGVVLLWI